MASARRGEYMRQHAEEMKVDYQEAVRERDTAVANGDLDTAAEWDDQCERLEKDWAQTFPPQPQRNIPWENWIKQNST